jgi:hypothetical protein
MENLNDILGGQRVVEEKARQKEVDETEKNRQRLTELANEIKNGGSTGNRLHDNLIMTYGNWLLDEKIVDRYEIAEESLKGKVGEPVIVISRYLENIEHLWPGAIRQPKQMIREAITVGVLEGEDIIFDTNKKESFLPTSRYIDVSGTSKNDEVEKGNVLIDTIPFGGLVYQRNLGHDLGEKIHEIDKANLWLEQVSEPKPALELLAGYDNIQQWLSKGHDLQELYFFREIRKACNMLGIKPLEPTTVRQKDTMRAQMGIIV